MRLAPLCFIVTLLYTFGWTAFTAWRAVRTGDHPDIAHTAIATADGVGQVDTLIIIYSISTTVALDVLGGMLMVTVKYLEQKFVKPFIERRKAEGRVEGITVGREEGMIAGREEGMIAGREEGMTAGREEGMIAGMTAGMTAGIAVGEADANRRWTAWNSRRIEAERAGVPFDEPPPAS